MFFPSFFYVFSWCFSKCFPVFSCFFAFFHGASFLHGSQKGLPKAFLVPPADLKEPQRTPTSKPPKGKHPTKGFPTSSLEVGIELLNVKIRAVVAIVDAKQDLNSLAEEEGAPRFWGPKS